MIIPLPGQMAIEHARGELGVVGPLLVGWAPGRVNLIGEHTDYNDGFVLPVAIERVVALAGQVQLDSANRTVRLYSAHHRQTTTFQLDSLPTASDPQGQPLWARYVAGALGELRDAGVSLRGLVAAIAGDVPLGGGMSSSAALIMATLTWLDAALGLKRQPLDLARLGQRAETRGSGVRVGILDHAASILGKPGQAVLLDCRTLAYDYIPFALPGVGMMICETGVERSLASSAYNQRRGECEEAVAVLAAALKAEGDKRAITALRDVTEHDLARLGGDLTVPARIRARHVVSENARAIQASAALRAGDAARFGELLLDSHASLRDDYAVSCRELDAVVAIATRAPGALGARLVGAGFGGGALIVAPSGRLDAITARLAREYPARTGRQPTIHRFTAGGGPGSATIAQA